MVVTLGAVIVERAGVIVVVALVIARAVTGLMTVLRYELQYFDAVGRTTVNAARHGPVTQGPKAFRHEPSRKQVTAVTLGLARTEAVAQRPQMKETT